MENKIKEENCTKEKRNKNDNIEFSIVFNKDGDSFQNIMENILISKLANNINND